MRAPRRLGDEDGFSLVEVLVTIVIVGIAFAAILGAMVTSITVSDLHRKQASADALVRSGAEAVKDHTVAYAPCGGPNAYAPALPSAPSGYSVSVSSVQYWDGTSTNPAAFSGSCGTDQGLQKITIVAASSDGRATETLEILKRRTA